MRSLAAIAAIAALARPLDAQTVRGVLLDRGSDRPIELGVVSLFTSEGDSVDVDLTDGAGRFELTANEGGAFLLAASALGYRSTLASSVLDLGDGSTMSLEFRLDPVPIEIGGLDVELEAYVHAQPELVRNGFVDRAQGGMGRFITPPEIAASPAFSTTELLANTGRVVTRFRFGGDRILMAPAQFAMGLWRCGVVVIWTRRG